MINDKLRTPTIFKSIDTWPRCEYCGKMFSCMMHSNILCHEDCAFEYDNDCQKAHYEFCNCNYYDIYITQRELLEQEIIQLRLDMQALKDQNVYYKAELHFLSDKEYKMRHERYDTSERIVKLKDEIIRLNRTIAKLKDDLFYAKNKL